MSRETGPKHLQESDNVSRRTLLVTPALGLALAMIGGDALSAPQTTNVSLSGEKTAGVKDPMYFEVDVPPHNAPSHISRTGIRKPPPRTSKPTRGAQVQRMRQQILTTAKSFYGVPYVWAGATRRGVDCSGLTMMVYRAVGLALPHFADSQKDIFRQVRNPLPGDLVFFLSGGYAFHVGLFTGRGRMIDAPRPGKTVGEHNIWSSNVIFGRHPSLA